MSSGAASLPHAGGDPGGVGLPDLDRLRAALRPAQLPLPTPRDVREATGRVNDLLHEGRLGEAQALAEQFRSVSAPVEDRIALQRAALYAAARSGEEERVAQEALELVSLLRRSGAQELAAAVVAVLLERGGSAAHASATTRAALQQAPTSRGRRRGPELQAPPEMLVVVRALERAAAYRADGAGQDPRRDAARLRAALNALPAVRERLLADPGPELQVRLAQALEAGGDAAGATTAALDALDALEESVAFAEGPEDWISLADPRTDPGRLAIAAHAVLARTLGIERPLQAADHALEALERMPGIEDPPLRIGVITALLQALMAAGATSEASFTAGRLTSLQRTLDRDADRIAPLLAVTAQRLQAERYDAARVPLERARDLARELRDRPALLEVARLAASLHERTGDHAASLRELRAMADQARWLADDLAIPSSARAELIRTELQAHALAMRRALDLGRLDAVEDAVRAIERRTRPDGGRPVLPEELLWDHRVDARVVRFIAVSDALGRGAAGADEETCARRRREVLEALEEVPEGHEGRARYWAVYLEDRHAHLLADRGRHDEALTAARHAREGWSHLGREEDLARVETLLRALAEQATPQR